MLFVCWIVWLNIAGNKVKLQTFKSWNFEEFGFKILEENGISYVNYVWCKICPKNKECIKQDPSVKGASKIVAEVFIDGTKYVTKLTVRILLQITQRISNFGIYFSLGYYVLRNMLVLFVCFFCCCPHLSAKTSKKLLLLLVRAFSL